MPKALVGGRVIDGTGRDPIDDAVVLIDGDRIDAVFRRGEMDLADGTEVVDITGSTVMPGLIDCHVHVGVLADNSFLQVEDPTGLADLFMTTLLSHGVTTVRDTGNFDPDEVFRTFKEGKANWPRFFGAGTILDGPADPPAPWRWLAIIDDEDSARREASKLIDAGMDFLKVYVWATLPVLRAVVSEAHRRGVRVAAHVGHMVTVKEAVQVGVDALEHVRIGRELVSEDRMDELNGLTGRILDPLVGWQPWRFVDPHSGLADDLISLMAEKGTYITPTLTLSQAILLGNTPEAVNPAGLDEMPGAVQEQWTQYAYPFDYSDTDWEAAPVELRNQMAFIGRAQESGVNVTAGTDLTNPFVVPGHSMHEELRLLVEGCGFSPMDAIVAATSRAADLLGEGDDLGSVEKRKLADLVVLDGDPLEDIRNTQQITAVYKGGQPVTG
ncbi:MAG: amidohydrolase family protein [bacterium]|nr:amidohydrolase family protein [Acidimicrobiia bacterium]MCY4650211.1 amidohydrolase family protein [bacterium]